MTSGGEEEVVIGKGLICPACGDDRVRLGSSGIGQFPRWECQNWNCLWAAVATPVTEAGKFQVKRLVHMNLLRAREIRMLSTRLTCPQCRLGMVALDQVGGAEWSWRCRACSWWCPVRPPSGEGWSGRLKYKALQVANSKEASKPVGMSVAEVLARLDWARGLVSGGV